MTNINCCVECTEYGECIYIEKDESLTLFDL